MRADRLDETEGLSSRVGDHSWPVRAPIKLRLRESVGVSVLLTTLNHCSPEPRFSYFSPAELLHNLLKVEVSFPVGEFLWVVQEAGGWSVFGVVRSKSVRPKPSAHVLEADSVAHLCSHSA